MERRRESGVNKEKGKAREERRDGSGNEQTTADFAQNRSLEITTMRLFLFYI